MKTDNYNQYQSYYTKNSCSIVSMLNVFKYRYAIFVVPDFMIKLAIFFDKLWFFSITQWATFKIIDNAMVYYLNLKLGLKFKLHVTQISKLPKTDKWTYQLWIPSYSTYKYNKMKAGWIITKEDIDYANTFSWSLGHAAWFDMSAGGYFIDTDWWDNTKMSYAILKYWQKTGQFWDNIRAIVPADNFTKEVCKLTIELYLAEKRGKLNLLYNRYSDNKYLPKAKKLYFFWR